MLNSFYLRCLRILSYLIGSRLGWAIGNNLHSVRVLGGNIVLPYQTRDHFRHLASMAGLGGERE